VVVGIILIVLLLLFTGFVIVKETNQQLFWRSLVAKGDVEAIQQIIEIEVEHWHESRVPKGTSALLWHGIQTVELTDVTPKGARVNCSAEGEYALVGGQRVESSSPLAEGMKITMKLAEMMLYDVPNVKLDHVQIDVYTSFRDEEGRAQPRCILSTDVERRAVGHIDWEQTTPADFIKLTDARFAASATDRLQPVEPHAFATDASAN
jgi:hypothetical protein